MLTSCILLLLDYQLIGLPNPFAGPFSSKSQDKPGFGGSCTCDKHNAFAGISSSFTTPTGWSTSPPFGSSLGAHANPATPALSQGTNTGFNVQPFGLGAAFGSFALPFMNYVPPTTVPCWPINGGAMPLCVPGFVPYFHPCASSIWAPLSCIIPGIGSNRLPTTEFIGVNGLNSTQSTDNASGPSAPTEVSNRSSPCGSPIKVSKGPSRLKGNDKVSSTNSMPTTSSTDHKGEEKA